MTAHASSQSPSAPDAQTAEYSESIPGAPLEAVLCVDELQRRPSRPPDEESLNGAVKIILNGLASSPHAVLQSLADAILDVMHCDSAGVSLVNDDNSRFYWPAIAGVWKPHIGGGTPRHFGPCGDVLRFNRSLHMKQIHLRYTYFTPVALVKEVLLVPFYLDNKAVGTIWAVIHEPPNNLNSTRRNPEAFDREDLRMLEALGRLATSAYQVWMGRKGNGDRSEPSPPDSAPS